jgi:hypothetical protein
MPYEQGYDSKNAMTPEQWDKSGMSTFLSIMFEDQDGNIIDLGHTKSTRSVLHGSEHAEDVALRLIRDNIGMFDPQRRNHIILSVTKSPCTSTSRNGLPVTSSKQVGCTEELLNLVNNGVQSNGNLYQFRLTLICHGLYSPFPGSADKRQASQEAINALDANANIEVSGDVRPQNRQRRFELQ